MHEAVCPEMRQDIRLRLHEMEQTEGISILIAIESGSRAWGFHSPDSDYDVRFIYTRPIEWHYRLGKKRDVVEQPISEDLDISGWELSKALTLMLGSNAVVAEWLQSPITYMQDREALCALSDFADRCLDRRSVSWHYLSLVERQLSRLKTPDGAIRLKRLFYILRPALALRWMRLHEQAMPPMDMARLRAGCALDPAIAEALDVLTAQKKQAREKATLETIDPVLEALVEQEVALVREWLATADTTLKQSPKQLLWNEADRLHRTISEQSFAEG